MKISKEKNRRRKERRKRSKQKHSGDKLTLGVPLLTTVSIKGRSIDRLIDRSVDQ